MATYYVDPSALTNGVGSEVDPFNILPANFSSAGFINGDVILLKRGTIYTPSWGGVDGDCFTVNRAVTIKDYGTGLKPVISSNFTGSGNGKLFRCFSACTFQNIEFKDSFLCHTIYAQGGLTDFTVVDCSFNNVARTTPALFHNALTLPVTGTFSGVVTVARNTFNGIGNDAMLISCSGKIIISDNIIGNVSLDALNGDCISVAGNCSFLEVYNNQCSHTNKNVKQCFIQDGGSTGYAYIHDNVFDGYFSDDGPNHTGLYLSLPGVVTRNIIKTWRSTCFAAGGDITFSDNLIVSGGGDPSSGAIWSTQTSLKVYNNTIVMQGKTDLAKAAISINQSNANIDFKNNLIIGFNRGIAKGTLATESYNAFWKVTTPVVDTGLSEISADASDITSNPQLREVYTLTNISPLIHAGIFINISRDCNNSHRHNPPSIGAYEYVAPRGNR